MLLLLLHFFVKAIRRYLITLLQCTSSAAKSLLLQEIIESMVASYGTIWLMASYNRIALQVKLTATSVEDHGYPIQDAGTCIFVVARQLNGQMFWDIYLTTSNSDTKKRARYLLEKCLAVFQRKHRTFFSLSQRLDQFFSLLTRIIGVMGKIFITHSACQL